MLREKNIVLIGFMGTGKSSLGKELSQSLDREYIDTDKIIEEKMNISIPEIFRIHGEDYFRRLERETIRELSQLEGVIISCGGGVPLDPKNIVNLRKKGKIILLEADLETIIKRTARDSDRPLLEGRDSREAVKELMDSRRESYLQGADMIVDTSAKNLKELRDEIIKWMEK